ncbi:hypothetical protein H9Y04_36180 [Streptomyces sp. TRM66268-LWL]|uniref:WXG100 family type VII secretion target n=1 Tax=Streptomyces polyasparticus TaxID=2767826 RepID=A0ABR7STJ8_9ACTN|nr:hypothetical protein [Streptomyces polyasparticus]MBC9717985.1 hypothetical protein [Streptomyces polyasparticus]
MIEPGGIPQYTGNPGELEKAISGLQDNAIGIRNGGADVHSRFQAMAAYYKAPEAEKLFGTTQPVMDTAEEFATSLETVATALDIYATEIKPLATKLEQLKSDAVAFLNSVDGDDEWTQDQDKLDRHQSLLDGVQAATLAFQAAERAAADKINAASGLMCRPKWVADDGTHQANMYGYTADMLNNAEELPWGTPEGKTYERWSLDWWGHGVKSWAWDGIVMDSVVGGLDGLWTLAGGHGAEERDLAWDGLRRAFVGTYAYGMDAIGQGEHLSDWQRESKLYAKEFGKSFIAYDMWEENPARAHAVTSFNIFTLGAGGIGALSKLGKGGSLARAGSTVARAGEWLDPLTAGFRASKAAVSLPKVQAVMANLSASFGSMPNTRIPDAILDLDGRYVVDDQGRLVPINADGTPDFTPPRREGSAAERVGDSTRPEHELAGVGGRGPEASAHADGPGPASGQGPGDRGGVGDSGRGGSAAAGQAEASSPGHAETTPGGHVDGPATGHGDGPLDGGFGDRTPAGDGPGTGGQEPDPAGPAPDADPQPMVRGGETEQRLRDAIKGIPGKQRPKPDVLERALQRLASEPDGARVAEVIASGRFNQSDEFGQVVSALGARKEQMFQPSADQILFADDLVSSGVPAHSIDFEQKIPVGSDIDIKVKTDEGEVYGYQLKHLNDPLDPVSEITRGKYLLQLARAEADHHLLLVDGGAGTRADWIANGSFDALMDIHRGGRGPKGEGITFVIRLDDGTLVIPPGSKTDPKDML